MNNTGKIFLAFIFSMIVFFIFGEIIIRVYLNYKTVYDIEMTKYAMSVKKDSDNPLIGHIHRPNVTKHLMNSTVKINSDGLRDREYPIAKGDSYRIAVLGDSLTFGWGVEHEDSFENILETEINKRYPVELINFGAGNYNTEQEVNLFLEKGLKYKPDKVIAFYFINDAEVTPKKSKLWFLGYSRFISFYWSRIHALLNRQVESKSFKSFYSELYADDHEGWIRTKKAFLDLKEICRKEKIELQVVLLPELHDVDNTIFNDIYDKVSGFLSDNGISNLNLAGTFSSYKNPIDLWVSYDDAHPNKLAHKIIAEKTLDFVLLKGDVSR
ncbi:MAG: SGNH/GDSL hydrolase family protein [Nitrospiraceae bacterium]|nr:MAG: SGNH/GDSL hydrolase family protein [Nitrospiraceae bacterium]